MAFSRIDNHFIERTTKAYKQFQQNQIPFSALRLGFSDSNVKNKQLKQIIHDNFRKTDEILGELDDSYAVLLKGASFDSAVAASERLATKLLNIKNSDSDIKGNRNDLTASIDIIGCHQRSDQLQRAHLELDPKMNQTKFSKPVKKEILAYLKHSGNAEYGSGKAHHTVNINV